MNDVVDNVTSGNDLSNLNSTPNQIYSKGSYPCLHVESLVELLKTCIQMPESHPKMMVLWAWCGATCF